KLACVISSRRQVQQAIWFVSTSISAGFHWLDDGLFRLQKVSARQAGRIRSHVRAERRNGQAVITNFNTHAAVLRGVQHFGAMQTERVLYAFGRRLITQTSAAADDDIFGAAPLSEFSGAGARAAVVGRQNDVAVERLF